MIAMEASPISKIGRSLDDIVAGRRAKPWFPRRVLVGAFLAPMIAPLATALLALAEVVRGANLDLTSPTEYVVFWTMFSFAFGYLPCLLFGLPTIALLHRRDALTARNCVFASFTLSVIVPAAVLVATRRLPIIGCAVIEVGVVVVGLLIAVTFCLIAGLPFNGRTRLPNVG
jgi:hypothetical protein